MDRALVPLLLTAAACRAAPPPAVPAAAPEPGSGTSIVVAGERVDVGTRVVLWDEPPYFDAYARTPRFDPDAPAGEGPRFRPGREGLGARPGPDELRAGVDQLVLHYDACGSSARCFRVLHDLRGLSSHFLLDVDGTIYQTLDVRDQAWHATKANRRSVGVEIANVGAYPPGDAAVLWEHHGVAPGAPSSRVGGAEVAFVEGVAQGRRLVQAEYAPAQLAALAKLAAGLCRALPAIRPDAPRGPGGAVRAAVLPDAEWDAFAGVLGHHHVQANKVDPGPAFPWEAFLERVRAELAR